MLRDDESPVVEMPSGPPQHGYHGEPIPAMPALPKALTIAVSREAGARGGTIGRRVANKLGWQVYDKELLEYVAQDGPSHQKMIDGLSSEVRDWIHDRLIELQRSKRLSTETDLVNMARVILALGSEGNVVIIGRGAGFLLPRDSTLHVRLIAPLSERIAYMGQWLRLTTEEATQRVELRDRRRASFLEAYLHCTPGDPYAHDLIVNTSHLTEDQCADLIVHAAAIKAAHRYPSSQQ